MTHRPHTHWTLIPLALILGLAAAPAGAEGITPPPPPVVDVPPPPPVPVTVYPEDDRAEPRPEAQADAGVRRVAARPAYQQPAGDPYGFTAWLNGIRAQSGLGAVGFDPNLSSWANVNNGQQQARGLGHFVMGPARRQNSGMGDYASVLQMWMASPPHQAALLDPTISWIGIAGLGAYWTYNAN